MHFFLSKTNMQNNVTAGLVVGGVVGQVVLLAHLARLLGLHRLQLGTGGDTMAQTAAVGTPAIA